MDYTIIIKVAGEKGEENLSINRLSSSDLEIITPMIQDIREHRGWYPCGSFYKGGPSPRQLYRHHLGWDVFNSIVPNPPSGFALVVSIEVYSQEPITLNMTC